MKIIKLLSLACLLLILIAGEELLAGDPGSKGFSFLKVSRGAQNAGMGDIGVAVSSNLYSVYFNPATTSGITDLSVGFMHQEYIFDTRREFIGGALPFVQGGLSFGFDFFKVADIERREGPTEQPIGYFDAQDILFYLGYARKLGNRFSIGLCGKYTAERIESETADAFLVDIGALFRVNEHILIGAAGRNIGSKPKFVTEEIEVPVIVTAGVTVTARQFILGADLSLPNDSDVRVNVGVERKFTDFMALRAGYKFGYDEENMAFGLGLFKGIWQVDYAFTPYTSGLGSGHRFALTAHWR